MPNDYIAIFLYHHAYSLQILSLDSVLFVENKLVSIPYIFRHAVFSYNMHMYRFMFATKKHERKSKGSEYFRHTLICFYHKTNIGIIYDTSKRQNKFQRNILIYKRIR